MLNIILAIGSLLAVITTPLYLFLMNRRLDDKIDDAKGWILEFYAQEKNDLIENLPKIGEKLGLSLLSSTKFSDLGKLSGQSRSMKSMEKELITDFVDSKYPGMGGMAAKYLQKYPFLQQFLGNLQQGNGGEQTSRSQGVM